jgi:DNA modification methylase
MDGIKLIKQSIKQEPFYECEDGLLYCADCMDILPQLPEGCVDLTVTSPPYDNLRDYKGFSFDFESIAPQIHRITTEGGICVWIVADQTIDGTETGTSFRQALQFMDFGFNLHDTMIYQKTGLTFPETNRYYPCFEYMFILSKGRPATVNLIADRKNRNPGGTGGTFRQPNGELKKGYGHQIKEIGVRFNIWSYDTGLHKTTKETECFIHPAMFPEKLAEDHIKSWSNEGDLVLDPMAGMCTTAIASKRLGRKFLMCEISEEYCRIAKDRIQAEEKGISVQELKTGQRTLWESDMRVK